MTSLGNTAHFFSTHPLTRKAPLKAWARFVSWQIRSRLQDEVVLPWLAGQRLAARRGMTGATGNIYAGLHEFADMMFVLHFLRKGDLFLDVGANIGSYTILASGVCRAAVWAFEPDPNTVRSLKRNVELNDLNSLVTVYELALGSTAGEVPFTVGQDTENRVVTNAGDTNIRMVNQQPLDALNRADAQPIMIKMDVEGYEEEVLRGGQRLLANEALKVIEIETANSASVELLNSLRFTRAYYDPFVRKLQTRPADTFSSSNVLFVRDWEFARSRVTTADRITVLGQSI
jgi:FkbM family methyltransferase